jgi:hypothetical protein
MRLGSNGILLPSGRYHTEATAYGQSPAGESVASNVGRTDFEIRYSQAADDLMTARAAGDEEEAVLGAVAACPLQDENILPYVLLFLLSAYWLIDRTRRTAEAWKN